MDKSYLKASQNYPEWDLLATWIAVVDSGSVSSAAKLLGVSQAAVSQRLKMLEENLGCELLDRATRPALPTLAGERLFRSANQLLAQAAETMEHVRGLSRFKREIVRFGCVDSFAGTLGPALIHGLTGKTHKTLLWSGLSPRLDEQLRNRQLDLAITTLGSSSSPLIQKTPLFTEPYLLVLPRNFEIGSAQSFVDLAKRTSFIRYSSRSEIGQDIDKFLNSIDEPVERTFELDNTDPLLSLVSAGLGFSLTTPICIWQARHFIPELRVLPIKSLPKFAQIPFTEPRRTFYLTYRQHELGRIPTEAAEVIRLSIEALMTKDVAPALNLPAQHLWSPVTTSGDLPQNPNTLQQTGTTFASESDE